MKFYPILINLCYTSLMKKRRLWIFIVLLSIAFSTLHAFVYAPHASDHCDMIEYLQEQNGPTEMEGDGLCSSHFEFHQSFTLPEYAPFSVVLPRGELFFSLTPLHEAHYPHSLSKPPIIFS